VRCRGWCCDWKKVTAAGSSGTWCKSRSCIYTWMRFIRRCAVAGGWFRCRCWWRLGRENGEKVEGAVLRVFFGLWISGQMKLHRINGYRDIGGKEKAAA
jgi:hypothetical protein